jgi:hypothetical protein
MQEVNENPILDDEDVEELERTHFEIENDGAAAWAMRKLRRIRQQQQTNQQVAEEEHQRVQEWLDEVNRGLNRSATYFEAILSHYALRCRQDPNDGRKSISLPTGKIATRNPALHWHVDPTEFVPWAEAHRPDLLRVKVDPALAEIKRAFAPVFDAPTSDAVDPDSGEMIPGIRISSGDLTATVTTNPN